jgi:hypothetical protein
LAQKKSGKYGRSRRGGRWVGKGRKYKRMEKELREVVEEKTRRRP